MLAQKEQQVLELFLELGDKQAVADRLNLSRSTVRHHIRRIEQKGLAPWLTPAMTPEHLEMSKTTVQYNSAGQPIQEWRRLNPTVEMMKDVVAGMCEQVRGKARLKWRPSKKTDTEDLLFEFDIYDAHVGMYADERETRDENYDCDIAAKRMVATVEGLAQRARRPQKVVVVFGGDMLHADNRSNQTEMSGNILDVDTRYHRVVNYVIAACTDVVQIAAAIGAEVDIIVLEGNHSRHSEVWLAYVLEAFFCHEPNVNVRMHPSPRKAMVWGQNLLIWAHGDKIAAPKWAQIIAAEFPQAWGATKFRHLKCGHVHHQKVIAPVVVEEQAGIVVEYLPALCASDAWHSGAGFIGSQKGAVGFEYSKDLGCITRFFQPV